MARRAALIAAILGLLALAAGGGWWLLGSPGGPTDSAILGSPADAVATGDSRLARTGASGPTTEASDADPAPEAPVARPSLPLRAEDVTGEPGRGALRVRVVDPDGRPVTGAIVDLGFDPERVDDAEAESQQREWASRHHRARTDADGVAVVFVEFAGPFDEIAARLYVCADGFAPMVTMQGSLPCGTIRAGEESDAGTVQLERGGTLAGRVVDETGSPIQGAAVWFEVDWTVDPTWLARTRREPPSAAVRTDPAGRYACDRVPSRLAGVLRALATGWVPAELVIAPGTRHAHDLVLRQGRPLEGRVMSRGRPVPQARVTVGTRDHGMQLRADEDGRFAHPGVTAGHWYVNATEPDGGRDGSLELDITDGIAPLAEVVVDLDREADDPFPGSLIGTVVDADTGRPVPFPSAALHGFGFEDGELKEDWPVTEAVHDGRADGRFVFGWVSEGRYTLWVRARGYAETRVPLEIATVETANFVRVALGRTGARLSGSVRFPDGEPAANVSLRVIREHGTGDNIDRDWVIHLTPVSTDGAGKFAFERLAPGPVHLQVTAASAGGVDREAGPLAVPGTEVELVIERAGKIQGIVRSGDASVAEAWVFALAGDAQHWGQSDAEGRFRLQGVGLGPWRLGAVFPGSPCPHPSQGLDPTALPLAELTETRRVAEVELAYAPPGHVQGRILTDGPVDHGAMLYLREPQQRGPVYHGTMDPTGRFQVGPVPAGEYVLWGRAGSRHWSWSEYLPVVVAPGETTTRDLPIPGSTLQVTLRWPDGTLVEPGASARLYDPRQSPVIGGFEVGARGEGAVFSLPAGTYVVEIQSRFTADAAETERLQAAGVPYDRWPRSRGGISSAFSHGAAGSRLTLTLEPKQR